MQPQVEIAVNGPTMERHPQASAELARIRAARLHALGDQAGTTLGVTLLIATLAAAALHGHAPGRGLAAWLVVVWALSGVRWAVWRRVRIGAAAEDAAWRLWSRVFTAGSLAAGALWGLAPLLLPIPNGMFLYFFAGVVGGMCAGTTAVNSAFCPAVMAFVLPASLGQAAAFALSSTRTGGIAAFMVCVFGAALSASSAGAHRAFGRRVALQVRLELRERELIAAYEQLRAESEERRAVEHRLLHAQKMEAIGQLAGGIAHDVNNVLQGVLGAAELMSRHADEATRVRRLAEMLTASARRGSAVTRRLLLFVRTGELKAEAFALAPVLEGCREMLAGTLGPRVRVAVAVAEGLPPVLADRAQLEIVLVNLATNARDAMPAGGTVLLAAGLAADPPAQLPPRRFVRLIVSDEGTGMEPAVLARAAEPFFTTKPVGQGTGLGLAIAKGFAEKSGGLLGIESTPGAGTKVSLWLPVAG